MATSLENSVRNAAAKLADALEKTSELTIETMYVAVGADGTVDFAQAKPIARTVIKLDGDYQAIIPMRATATGALEQDEALLQLHQEHVKAAIENRDKVLHALLSILPVRSR